MVFINRNSRELNAKIVYVGPAGSGKTTNLRVISERTDKEYVGELICLERDRSHTAYFDFLPLYLGRIRGFKARLLVYAIPGAIPFETSRRMIFNGVDAVVFVADSDPTRVQENLDCLTETYKLFDTYNIDPSKIPFIFQLNKRDLPHAVPEYELIRLLSTTDRPVFPAVAQNGKGVFDTFREASRRVLDKMKRPPE